MEMTREQVEKMFAYARKFGGEGLDALFARLLAHDQAQRDKLAAVEQERQRLNHEHDYDTKVTIPDLQQQLTDAQATIAELMEEVASNGLLEETRKGRVQKLEATIQRLTEARQQDVRYLRAQYASIVEIHDQTLQRLATVEAAAKGVDECWNFQPGDEKSPPPYMDLIDTDRLMALRTALAPAPGQEWG